jgi:hypothetical protein
MTPEVWGEDEPVLLARTQEEAEVRAQDEHAAYAGRLLVVAPAGVYFGRHAKIPSPSRDTLVRVLPVRSAPHPVWRFGWLDPRWDVTVVEDPDGRARRNAWIYGRSYRVDKNMSPMEELAQIARVIDYQELK